MLYSEKVMDHFQNPRNVGKMEDASGVGEVGNARCGDIMRMYIKVEDGIITDVKFNTFQKHWSCPTRPLLRLWMDCLPRRSTVPCWRKKR